MPSAGPKQAAHKNDQRSDTAAAREQVEDEYDDCKDEEDVNQSAADVKGETKKPENE